MTSRRSFLLLAVFAAAACAKPASTRAGSMPAPSMPGTTAQRSAVPPAPSATSDIDPVGSYAVNLTAQGSPLTVNAKIERRPDGSYGGTVTSEVAPPLPIKSVTVKGKAMRVVVTGPEGVDAILNLTVDGDRLSGDWAMGNDGSAVSGKKLP